MLLRHAICALFRITLVFASPVARSQNCNFPGYVHQFAPVAYLHSEEIYFPSSIPAQINYTHPEDNHGNSIISPVSLNLNNLNTLNVFADDGENVFLTTIEGIQALPSWLLGTKPSASGSIGTTFASLIVTVIKPGNILDAFYFYFYAYNQGNWVLDLPSLEFGDHVGDWEHTMLRFVDGVPQVMWFSQHASGEAFSYSAVEKYNGQIRPVVYVANGSHANYAVPGDHDHTIPNLNLPGGPVEDHTNGGIFWDPLSNVYAYSFDNLTKAFTAYNGADPTAWLDFTGRWGDNHLPDSTDGQVDVFGERKFTSGPTGPANKDLGRTNVCSGDGSCSVKTQLSV